MKIHLVMLGKTRIPDVRRLLEDYIRRIEHFAEVQVTELRDAAAWRKQKLDSHAAIVALDAAGKQFTSQQFAKWLGVQRDSGLRELVILCGDADGFSRAIGAKGRPIRGHSG